MTAKSGRFSRKESGMISGILRKLRLLRADCIFLCFLHCMQKKRRFCAAKNAFGRTTAFLAPRMPSQNKKAIPYGMTFCFGGDKRDRTADLMTASCYRFVILSVFVSNPSVPSAKSAEFHGDLSTASTRFRAHLGHNLGQGTQVNSENF